MPARDPDPRSFLPLTPHVLQVMLAIAGQPLHGYGIIQEVEARTDGLIHLRSGTLYVLLRRLVAQHLIDEAEDRPAPDDDDERRRYYGLTGLGRTVLRAETKRVESALSEVHRRRLFERT